MSIYRATYVLAALCQGSVRRGLDRHPLEPPPSPSSGALAAVEPAADTRRSDHRTGQVNPHTAPGAPVHFQLGAISLRIWSPRLEIVAHDIIRLIARAFSFGVHSGEPFRTR